MSPVTLIVYVSDEGRLGGKGVETHPEGDGGRGCECARVCPTPDSHWNEGAPEGAFPGKGTRRAGGPAGVRVVRRHPCEGPVGGRGAERIPLTTAGRSATVTGAPGES